LVLRNESSVGPAASRNTGAAAGDAPYVVFLDDDVRPAGELLARHAGVFARNPGPVVSIGALLPPATGGLPPWDDWQADRVAREHRRLARGEVSPSWLHLYTGNVGVRRVDFVEVGGFDDAFARQEDMELGFRLSQLGCRFVFEPAAVAWHENEHSLSSWLRLPAANARNDVLMDRLRPESERLRSLHEELRGRHWLLRLARRALGRPAVSERSARLAAWAGTGLYRLGARRPALSAFSLAWDLEYHRGLAEATDRAEGKQPPSGP
jgi:GT2 family glycosyltransferase